MKPTQNSKKSLPSANRAADSSRELAALRRFQAVAEFKPDGAILTANQNFLDLTGYDLSEIKGRKHSDLVDEAYAAGTAYRELWSALNRGEAQTGEFPFAGKRTKEIWVRGSWTPVYDSKGKLMSVVLYATDVTAETAARHLAVKLKSAVDHVSSAIMMVDRDFVVTYVNGTTRSMLAKNVEHFRALWPNFTPEKIVGTCIDMFHRNPAHQRGLLADPKNLPYRTDISVGPLKFSLCVNASYDLLGNYSGNILEWADVTSIRKQEAVNADYASQIAAIEKYQALIEFKLDGTIVTANQNFLDTVGYRLDEIQGKHHSMFCDAAYRQSAEYKQFWEKLAQGEAAVGQFRRFGRNEKEVWLQASYNPIVDLKGKPCRVVKFATDITASKQLENQMKSAMEESGRVMKALADGRLTDEMQGRYEGEFDQLAKAINTCVVNLRDMVGQIRNSASTISASATEISQGNSDLSQRTEQQATSIEETASSMVELTTTVKQNADNARQASQLAASAREQAEKGGSVVSTAISAMSQINEASKKIADIIGVIDEIAFQTNLLALNAAVEAARAGEQGRGFAVVAAEVRNLAQRSAGAAKEIKTLIKDSVSKVEEGSRLVNESGNTLSVIVASVKKVSDIVAEIAEASSEQSAGIGKVNEAISLMDKAVQQNAALVEEAAAASGSMDEQSRALDHLMEFFKLDEGSGIENLAVAVARPSQGKPRPAAARTSPGRSPVRAAAAPVPVRSSRPRPSAVKAAGDDGDGNWEEF